MKFDYRVIIVGGIAKISVATASEFQDKANELGQEGFELVSFRDTQTAGKFIAVFKRKLDD